MTEYRVRHQDGRWLHVEDRAMVLKDGDGKPVRMVGCTVDVTEQKARQQAVRANETFISGVLGSITDAFLAFDAGWRVTFANDKIIERFGLRRDEVVGGHLWEMFPAAVGNEAYVQLHGAMADRAAVEYEVFYDPWQRWFLDKAYPTDDGGLAVYSRDITDRKRAEGRLQQGRERLTFALAAADLGQWELNLLDGTASRTLRHDQIFGYDAPLPEWTYETFLEHVVPDDRADVDARFQAAVATGTVWDIECRIRRADGAERCIWTKASIQRGGQGRVERMLGIVGDQTDRKRAEGAERAAEARLRLALTAARMVAFEFDPATGGVVNSDNAADVFGLPPGTGLGDIARGFALLHPDDADAHRAVIAGAVGRAAGYVSRFRVVRPDTGAVVWMEEHGQALRGPGGAVRLVGIVMDVTARHEAEAERDHLLRRVEAERGQLADVFRQAPAFLCVLRGPDHVFELANDRYHQLVGRRDLLGKTVREAFPEVEEQGFIGLLDGVYRTGEPFVGTGVRLLFAQQPGQPADERYVDFVYQALRDPDGGVTGVVVVGVDVTQRVRQEKELEYGQRTLSTLVERCPFGIYIVDADFRIASMNAGSQAGAFANVRPVIGRPFDEAMRIIWPEPVAADVLRTFRHTLATGEPYYSKDFVNPRADIGQTEGYEWELHRVTMPDGRPGVVCYYYDSTKLRQAEQRLKEADQKKDEFLATLAHELRNPLAPIRNGLQIMKLAGGDAGAVEKSRSMMERQVGQMTHLIDDLMDLSRVSRGKIVLQKTRLRLADAVRNAVDTSRPLIEERGHDLVLDVPPDPIYVDGDNTRLCQVFANLLNNAAKYTDPGGRIRLAVERQGGDVVVGVEDNGMGIPAHMLTRVFDMFAQVDRGLEKAQGGLGIGLNIVKRLVDMHDGGIAAESAGHGTGSRFVVRLPVVLAVTSADPDGGGGETAKPAARRRILVVDDNADGAGSLALMLQVMGNETRTAHDGLEAVAVAEVFRPDVILMDIGMPRLNGYEACRRIRQEAWGRAVVLVAQTGWGQDDDKRKSREAGFDFHLVKPVDPAALEKMLAGLLVTTG